MSADQNEINNLKNMLMELSKRMDDSVSKPKDITEEFEVNNKTDSALYLKLYELQIELDEANQKNQLLQQDILALRKERTDLENKDNINTQQTKNYIKQVKQHEERTRKLFELYSADKEEIFKYQLLVEKSKQELYTLRNELDKQEQRYENLKNQLSYRLGSRLVGIKQSKDLLKLPKILLDDYVAVKSKINSPSTLSLTTQQVSQTPQLPYSSNREYTFFNKSVTLPLKKKLSTLIFNKGFSGSLDLQLYGVKPSTSIDIELSIRTYQGDCVFRVTPDLKHLHHLAANESMTIHVTIDDNQAHPFMDMISTNGMVEISFEKKRGVPSFIHLFQVESRNNIVLDTNTNIYDEQLLSEHNLSVPEIGKKSWIFRQAIEVQEQYGFAIADAFINKYVNDEHRNTISIFYANNNLDKEQSWLDHINNYIASYDMQSIFLDSEKHKEKFFRISSSIDYKIDDTIRITVIMPAYNAEKTIEHSIRSILNQTWSNLELIVINDCSIDRTLDIIEKLALTDSRVKIINNPANVGAYVSKNLGLMLAEGNYITGHDADDWAFPQRLEHHMNLIRSEPIPPRASNTRMIRMEENGYLPLYPFGAFCHDGVMRVASITCMFEASFLRDTLGGWDCSRFGADSEIISRCKMVIGDEFKNYKSLSMICLDEPTSLTNHPTHGVSKSTGISPSRKFYKEQWQNWQKAIDKDNVRLEFPHVNRKFEVPEGTEIPIESIKRVIENVENKIKV